MSDLILELGQNRTAAARLLGSEFDALRGRMHIDPTKHYTRLYLRIGRVGNDGRFAVIAEWSAGVEAGPYRVDHGADECCVNAGSPGAADD